MRQYPAPEVERAVKVQEVLLRAMARDHVVADGGDHIGGAD